MRCKIGNGLKEIFIVLAGLSTAIGVFAITCYIIGYTQLYIWDGLAIVGNSPTGYYLNAGSTIFFIIISIGGVSFALLKFINLIMFSPRTIINFFIKCEG